MVAHGQHDHTNIKLTKRTMRGKESNYEHEE